MLQIPFKKVRNVRFEVSEGQENECLAFWEKALRHGAEALGEIVEKKVPDVGILQFVYFRDPEGNIVEIQSWH